MTDQLTTEIIEKIKAYSDPSEAEVSASTELTDLGIHSLELAEMIFDLEDTFGIDIDVNTSDAWSSFKNVGDLVEAVRSVIAKKT